MKLFLLFIAIITSLSARVNPFFPPKESESPSITNNTVVQHPALKSISMVLPSSARVVKEISVAYINIDGSEERKTISVDNSVDWHQPIVISQSGALQSNSLSPKNIPVLVKNDPSYRDVANFQNVSFFVKNKTLKITTKDTYIQNFLMVNPYRVVLDFKGDYSFQSFSKNVQGSVFKSVRIGNHDGYYRVVVEFDGQYKYTFQKENGSYIIDLH